ncbi:MAG: amino acid ABC transporter permease [Coriobacteriales bacterium]|nr:amino acid ABC transporter permease [Coriobacteriales bacterium]
MTIQVMLGMLGNGLIVSLEVFVVTLIGSLPLGMLVCLGRMSRFAPLRWLMRFYISILRGTPLMLQLFVVYYCPYYIFGVSAGTGYRLTATFIAFILNYAAYFAEIYRSGLESIPKGQYEAATVLGYTKSQTFFQIILPQVIKRILPAMGNEVITLVKDTSLAFAIGVSEMFTAAKAIAASQRSMIAFAFAALIYWVVNLVIEFVMSRFEKRLAYYHE